MKKKEYIAPKVSPVHLDSKVLDFGFGSDSNNWGDAKGNNGSWDDSSLDDESDGLW